MSHSFDSTLLQRMGFRDPDRKTPEHDRACIEIATAPEAILRALGLEFDDARALLEQPLQKGEGKYASTVGFIDALVFGIKKTTQTSCEKDYVHRYQAKRERCERCVDFQVTYNRHTVLVEVKTRIENVGDLLRQMNLYREYKQKHEHNPVGPFVVWSLDAADHQYAKLLDGQGYTLLTGGSISDIGR